VRAPCPDGPAAVAPRDDRAAIAAPRRDDAPVPAPPQTTDPPIRTVVVGVGASRGCPEAELLALVDAALADVGLQRSDVRALASATVKADEPAIAATAATLGVPVLYGPAADLASVVVPTPSAVVAAAVGTPSVAEAAALLTAGTGDPQAARLLAPKRRSAQATCALAVAGTPDDVPVPKPRVGSVPLPGAPERTAAGAPRRAPHPIELESYRILRSRIDLSHLPPLSRAVTERTVHAVADVAFAETLVLDEDALRAGRDALLGGAPLIVDTGMAAAGITARETIVPLRDPRAAQRARETGSTRSAAAFALAAADHPDGAVWAIGNAPTALFALLEEIAAGRVRPALVIGLPVGFVGAAESKAALAAGGVACLTNRGERGGTPVTVAAIHALLFHRDDR
jgi:precorrin-8X/cobalt-precorrin-8 methylmutase